MTIRRNTIGRVPTLAGAWDASYVNPKTGHNGYPQKKRVTHLGSEFESLIEDNTYAPATLNQAGTQITFDTEHWLVISNGTDAYLLQNTVNEKLEEMDDVKDAIEAEQASQRESMATMQNTINAKQLEIGAVQTDPVPTQNSGNHMTSGDIYQTLKDSSKGFVDNVPAPDSDKIAKSGGVFRYLNDIRTELLKLTDEYYTIVNNNIDYANPGHDWQWRGTCVSCREGDVFFVKAMTPVYDKPPYAFIDSSGDVLLTRPDYNDLSYNDLSDSYHRIIAPANTAYVCFNSFISSYSTPSFHRLGNVLSFVVNKVYDNTDTTEFAPYKKQYCYIENGVFVESVIDINHRYYKIPCNAGDYINVRYLSLQGTTVHVTCAFIDNNNNVIWQPFKGDCSENKILRAPQDNSYFVLVFYIGSFTDNNAEIPFEVYKIQPNRINGQRAVVGEIIKFQSGYVRPSEPFNPGSDINWVYSIIKCSGNEKFVLNLRTATADIPIGIVCDLSGNVIDTINIIDCYESGLEYTTPVNAEFIIFNHANHSDAYPNYRVVRYGNGSTSYNQSIKELSNRIDKVQESIIVLDVKKDGSGDFTTIQAAINSITDASPNKRYEVRIYDDFDFEDADMFDYHNGPCAIVTKDYVDLVGMNGIRKLTYLPSSDKITSQIVWWVGNSNLKNLHFTITRGRYTVHGTYAGFTGTNIERYAENCVFEHIVVPSVSWGSQFALAEDVYTNQKEKFLRCKFISKIGGAVGHTMDVAYPQLKTEISFENCEFIVPKDKSAVGYSSLGTFGDYSVVIKDCIISGTINGYSSGNEPSNYGETINYPHYNIFNSGDNPYVSTSLKNLTVLSSSKNIKSVSGSALSVVFGDVLMQQKKANGIDSYIVGSYDLTYYANLAFSTGYKHSLAYRLGDCSGTNKTLVITYSDNTSETIVFDKNYRGSSDGTTEPSYTNEQVIAEINTQLSNSEVYYQIPASIYDYYMDSDLKVLKVNKTISAIQQGKFVTESLGGGIELADYTNYIGFALIDVPDKNEVLPSPICISKKIMLGQSYSPSVSNTTDGTTYTIQNGALIESSSNVVGVVYDNILYLK